MKKKFYLTLDTETATLPFANSICSTANDKQKIAISKPLVYDIGWVVTDRIGTVIKKVNYLVQETFFVPNIFNTAYYKDKRPIYMELLAKGEIECLAWNDIIKELLNDLQTVDISTAYNACFDFKKAIPFTEQYIYHLYNIDYNEWEEKQKKTCEFILRGESSSKNEDYLTPTFKLRGQEFPIADLWEIACERLINNNGYKNYCLENGLVSASVQYFKSSAETSFQYLMKDFDFIEEHTALSDAMIESQILTKALKKGKVEPILASFPFRQLGTTFEYVQSNPKYKDTIIELLKDYISSKGYSIGEIPSNPYWRNILNQYKMLAE